LRGRFAAEKEGEGREGAPPDVGPQAHPQTKILYKLLLKAYLNHA